ncbi:MAG TPA: hypothetical protein V6C81_03685 [Planktothrix sp.]|jgi:hypothetical protein
MQSSSVTQNETSTAHERYSFVPIAIAVIALAIATFIAYSPVLFNFFAGDDFAYLPWLRAAMHDPQVVWKNFYHPWMESRLTGFYRPFSTTVMAGEYMLWGANGLGFRLTNIVCNIVTSIFLGLCTFELIRTCDEKNSCPPGARFCAIAAGGLFALYPVHAEPVVWIIGRVDGMVTMFILSAFWCYMRWRRSAKFYYLPAACAASICALLTKEMGVVVAPLLVLYELIAYPHESLRARIVETARNTAIFWGILGLYFVVRRFALGTFLGGYDNSLLSTDTPDVLRYKWTLGLKMFVVPLNYALIGTHDLLYKIWIGLLAASSLASAWAFASSGAGRKLFVFVAGWMILCFVPIYKLFWVTDDLRGSRWIYLASAPLCLFLAYGLSMLGKYKLVGRIAQVLMAVYLVVACCALMKNNQAWATAGRTTNAIVAGLNEFYKTTPGDPSVAVAGLPADIQGAYACLNGLDGMTKRPLTDRDLHNCKPLDDSDPLLPFGFLKRSIAQAGDTLKIIRWNPATMKFDAVQLPAPSSAPPILKWSGNKLKEVVTVGSGYIWTSDATLQADGSETKPIDIDLKNMDCWPIDFIGVTVASYAGSSPATAYLEYKNELVHEWDSTARALSPIDASDKPQQLIFPLHSQATWALGDKCTGLRLTMPPHAQYKITGLAILNREDLMPIITFSGGGYLAAQGMMKLTAGHGASFDFDASGIPHASQLRMEIAPRSCFFADKNMQQLSAPLLLKRNLNQLRGTQHLQASDFPAPGLYALRLRALDQSGTPVGVASDHIFVSIE